MEKPIAVYEALYRETGNVTYLWEALADLGPDQPLPGWIRAYLADAAVAVAGMVHDGSLTPEQAVEKVPRALRIVGRGRNGNAFGARRQAERDTSLAWRYERAKTAWRAKRLGNTNELKSAIIEVLELKDMSSVERRIAKGRKIMRTAEQAAKKKG